MLIRFHSKAAADVLMLGVHAGEVLLALGREPAEQGIFLPADIPAALVRLEQAEHQAAAPAPPDEDPADPEPDPGLRQRAWPLREMLQWAAAANVPVIWQPL